MRKLRNIVLTILLLSTVIFFFVVSKVVDRSNNKKTELPQLEISERAKSLHQKLLVADMHADNLLWDRNPLNRSSHGMVDVPKLLEGNYALQVFDAVIQIPRNINYESNTNETDLIGWLAAVNRWPIKSWTSLYERAIHQSDILKDAAESSPSLELVQTKSDLSYLLSRRKSNSYLIGGILSIEGLHALEGEYGNLDRLYDAGYRMMGLVHFFDNKVGGSSAGVEKYGLTDFGKRIVLRMEQLGITVDLAHASPALIRDVLTIATRPVAISHTGVKGVHDSPRNLSDEEIKLIAQNGGLIGLGFWEEAAGSIDPITIAQSMRYVADLVGVEYVALGSDFDGAVEVSFDSSEIIQLTEALLREGFSNEEIQLIMGGNQIRFFQNNLPD